MVHTGRRFLKLEPGRGRGRGEGEERRREKRDDGTCGWSWQMMTVQHSWNENPVLFSIKVLSLLSLPIYFLMLGDAGSRMYSSRTKPH